MRSASRLQSIQHQVSGGAAAAAVDEDRKVYIVGAKRTPLGSFNGALSSVTGTELGSVAIAAALEQAGLKGTDVDEVFMGSVLQANLGQAPARQAALAAGVPFNVPATTVNKVCSSGMKSAMFGAQAIQLDQADVVVAGGMESMSKTPYYLDNARNGYRMNDGGVIDGMRKDGLWDPWNNMAMGNVGDMCAEEYGFTRQDQDAYAVESYRRAKVASEAGAFKNEIASVTTKKGAVVAVDEEFPRIKPEKVATMKPAFNPKGTVTAINASVLSDGGCALVLASGKAVREKGLKPIAVIRGYGDAEQDPIKFTTSPALAIPIALKRAGLTMADVDFAEINEAFSVVALANMKLLGLPHDKVNVNGGAVSLGHPLGASGARIVTTLVNVLEQKGGKIGVAGICNGGGGASAMVIEKL